MRVVVGAVCTLGMIALLHKYKGGGAAEGFSNSVVSVSPSSTPTVYTPSLTALAQDTLKANKIGASMNVFDTPSSKNPLSNVLVTDYLANPKKRPAPPLSQSLVQDQLLHNAKLLVNEANPGQADISDKLFKSLNEQLSFEQSLRPFHSNPSTTIPNDQGAFAEFCYGNMKSCKEGNLFACARNTSHYTLY